MKPRLDVTPKTEAMRFRIQIKHQVAIGPGKAEVLALIAETGSIAEAGRRLGMAYPTVWSLVRSMNKHFVLPLVESQRGGSTGGGARLTPLGEEVLALYREIESRAQAAVAPGVARLAALIRPEAGNETTAEPDRDVKPD
ncbi:MAG: winged helix-turn-helix domain-containing protein [Casimicrobiaceae bacterium]